MGIPLAFYTKMCFDSYIYGGSSSVIPPLLDHLTNNIQIDDNKKADILNKYFTEISTIEDAGIDVPEFAVKTQNTIDFIEIHQQDIIQFVC